MLQTTLAGSLPKPIWLAEPEKLWAPWKLQGEALEAGKRDATILSVKLQEDAGLDIVGDGEQARVHFVHGFLANLDGIDFAKKTIMGIRNNRYEAEVPTVTGPIRRKGPVHAMEAAAARAHTKRRLKFTLPGPMTIVDTIADEHYGRREDLAMAFAAVLNEEARELQAIGVDVIQFDEPAFNVYMGAVADWGIACLERAAQGLSVTGLRMGAVIVGSGLMAVGGAFLTLSAFSSFFFEMVNGRGWICVALVVFGAWKPGKAVLGAILFAAFDAYQVRLQQLTGAFVPYQIFLMMPYALSILALILVARRATYPKALMVPYQKGER